MIDLDHIIYDAEFWLGRLLPKSVKKTDDIFRVSTYHYNYNGRKIGIVVNYGSYGDLYGTINIFETVIFEWGYHRDSVKLGDMLSTGSMYLEKMNYISVPILGGGSLKAFVLPHFEYSKATIFADGDDPEFVMDNLLNDLAIVKLIV